MSSSIRIHKVSPLQPGESDYVKPMRIFFKQEGRERTWDCMKVHDSVAIVIYNVSRSVLVFVKQFRPAVLLSASLSDPSSTVPEDTKVTGFTLELCAGILDKKGKSPAETAQEEVMEETGYKVDVNDLKFVSSFRSGVGVSGSLQYLFFCEVSDELKVGKGGGVDDENIEVVELSIEQTREMVWKRDEDCSESRPASMLFALTWFLYVHQGNK